MYFSIVLCLLWTPPCRKRGAINSEWSWVHLRGLFCPKDRGCGKQLSASMLLDFSVYPGGLVGCKIIYWHSLIRLSPLWRIKRVARAGPRAWRQLAAWICWNPLFMLRLAALAKEVGEDKPDNVLQPWGEQRLTPKGTSSHLPCQSRYRGKRKAYSNQ